MPKHMKPLADKPSYCQKCQHDVQKTIDKERKVWEKKIVEGDMEQGTLLMHEQLLQLQRAALYAQKMVESEDPTKEEKKTN